MSIEKKPLAELDKKAGIESKHLRTINRILGKGDSVMISPSAKNGLRIMQVKKIPVKENEN